MSLPNEEAKLEKFNDIPSELVITDNKIGTCFGMSLIYKLSCKTVY